MTNENVIVESTHNHYTTTDVNLFKTKEEGAVLIENKTDSDVEVEHVEHEKIPLPGKFNCVLKVMEADPMNQGMMRQVAD